MITERDLNIGVYVLIWGSWIFLGVMFVVFIVRFIMFLQTGI